MRYLILSIFLCAGAALYGQNPAMIKAFHKKAQQAYDEGNYNQVLFCIDSAKEHLIEGTNNSDLLYLEAKTYYAIDPLAEVTTEVIQEYVNTSEATDMRQEEMADMLVSIELAAYEEKGKTIKPQKTLAVLEVKDQVILARNVFAVSNDTKNTAQDAPVQSKESTLKNVETALSYDIQEPAPSVYASTSPKIKQPEVSKISPIRDKSNEKEPITEEKIFTPVTQTKEEQKEEEKKKVQAFVNDFNNAQRQSSQNKNPIQIVKKTPVTEKSAAQKAMEAMAKAKNN